MKTLIVATDFSKEAENAIEYAGALAKQMHRKVILFNSFVIPIHATNSLLPASAFQEMISHNHEILRARALKLAESYSIEVGYESGLLDLNEGVEELIEKHNGSIVIMGMAAKSLDQDLFGNTTTSLMMKLRYPVLAVPVGSVFKGIDRILYACDELQDKTVLDKIRDIAVVLQAEIEIFHVGKHIARLVEQGAETLKEVPHYYKNVESGKVIDEIETEVIKSNIDLLIMVPHKYGFLDSILHRSKTRVMASNNKVPLLSLPGH
ncbi:MAG TPA: universal stress protein [Daejeonella sp.]|nr:universal stress protein [Daejeonella sp.]